MGLIEQVKSLVSKVEERTYSYECVECGTEFETVNYHPHDNYCPDCGSDKVHAPM